MINENEQTPYAIKLDNVLTRYPSRFLAEQALSHLPDNEKQRAKVVPITESGQEILFG